MSIVMSAIAFGGKPEAIMWKVKTIVGEERRNICRFIAAVICKILINRLTIVIFAYMMLLYLSNAIYMLREMLEIRLLN